MFKSIETKSLRFFEWVVALDAKKAGRVALAMFVLIFSIELGTILFNPLSLSPDEAYYWDWSRHLDLSYYDKGPGIAYIISFFCSIFGATAFGVRSGALFFQVLFFALLYQVMRKIALPGIAALMTVLLWSTLIFTSQGLFMTNDPPLTLFWLLSLVFALRAIKTDNSVWWIPCFVSAGVGTLCKYTAAFILPEIGLFLLLTPGLRHHLFRKGFIFGAIAFALTLTPIVLWNAQHNWVNFAHNAGQVVHGQGIRLQPHFVFELLLGQWGVIGPVLFFLMIAGFIEGFRQWRKGDVVAGFYLFSSLPLAALCFVISFTKSCYANWPMPIYIGGILLCAHLLSNGIWKTSRIRFWFGPALGVNLVVVTVIHLFLTGERFGFPPDWLPTKQLVGWTALGNEVSEILDEHCDSESLKGECDKLTVIGEKYSLSSELAFYVEDNPRVYVTVEPDRRMNQYDIWAGWKELEGKDALIVLRNPEKIELLRSKFREIVPVPDRPMLDALYDGEILRSHYFYIARDYDGSVPPSPLNR